jgi:cathepsin F/cysteine peptidase B
MNKILVVVLLGLLAIAFAAPNELRSKFLDFQRKYNKVYKTTAEFDHRFHIFQENLKKAAEIQKKNPKATFGVTKFSDLSEEEFSNFYLMPNLDLTKWQRPAEKNFSIPLPANRVSCSPNPTTYDWFADCSGVCTPIYNQGQCGSCWAFSATETIESYFAISGHPLTQLSMEQIVDCDTAGQDQGCNGGWPSGAYSYVESAGGIEPYSDYPYTAENGQSGQCQFNQQDVVATVTGFTTVSGETGLYSQTSSASGGPVSVCVDASTWSSYTGGVLTSCGNQVDHCVQLTGYNGYGQSGAYWIVRNSWGTDWGLSGFIWIQIGQDLCDIGDYATVVTSA